jgi:pyrroline-5-carboxylate reductase
VIRIMPNIPASVGTGVILYDHTENVTEEAVEAFRASMQHAGLVDPLPEKLIDAGSALSGCGPAFVSMFVEALADGAVACGLPRDKALAYAAQTVAGSAKMLLESGMHPGQLKDAVCSPAGSTIVGVNTLEQGGFRGSAMDAVIAAFEKTKELGK